MNTHVAAHPGWQQLVDYWLGDTDAEATASIDRHLMHCDECGARFDEVVALSRGVHEAFARGKVGAVLSAAFVERLKAAGRRVREYHLPHNGSVACSVAPGDELSVSHIAAPLAGVQRVDAVLAYSLDPAREERLRDVPFDAAAGEVLFVPRFETLRQLPSHELVLRLLAVDAGAERELGHYTFRHRGAEGGPAAGDPG